MTASWRREEPAAPVRAVHLGLGAFHRAHQAWYTHVANAAVDPAERWGIAAFTSPGGPAGAVRDLRAQDGLYTLLVRGRDGDTATVVESLVAVHDGADAAAWREYLARPEVGVVTLTVADGGYHADADGRLDLADDDVAGDVERLRPATGAWGPPPDGAAPVTVPGLLLDGMRARRAAAAGPLAVVSCDGLPADGTRTRSVVLDLAGVVDAALARWVEQQVSFVSTVADRLTAATTDTDRETVRRLTGHDDRCPVVAGPHHVWSLQGTFPADRPAWERAGARFVPDLHRPTHPPEENP